MPFVMFVVVGATLYGVLTLKALPQEEAQKRIPAALAGIVASGGLTLSKMVYPSVVLAFLDISRLPRRSWDGTLMMVMMGAVVVSFAAYQFVPDHALVTSCPKMEKPWTGTKFGVPTNQVIDWKLIVGATFFGMGWGISGLCPGPALLLTVAGVSGMILLWWPTFYVGMRLAEVVKDYTSTSAPPAPTSDKQGESDTVVVPQGESNTQEFHGEASEDFQSSENDKEEKSPVLEDKI